ncbi:MAG TPA: thioredoxin domain-containing protein, partial [Bryobacteraceae bacterium]
VYFKDLPIARRHPWAPAAAIAGRCIARQKSSSFWTYHDWAFAHQSEITEAGFRAQMLAATEPLALDKEALTACLDSRATEPEVTQSIAEATELGVPGTPTIFVNGRKLPSPSTAVLKSAIDFELQRKTRGLIPDCNCGDTANPKPH